MRFSIALVALIVAAATTAEAQDTQSADTIIRGCRSLVSDSTIDDPTDSFLAGICAGTIDGLAYEASMLKLSSASAPHAEVFCIPKEIKINQQIRVVVKYHRRTAGAHARALRPPCVVSADRSMALPELMDCGPWPSFTRSTAIR
jgi:hypothetical protein